MASAEAPLLSVRGEAVLEVEPEIVRITVIVAARDRDRRTVLDRLAQRNEQCLDLVKSYGEAVDTLETSGFSISPELKERRAGEKIRNYHGAVRTRVTLVDFSVLGELIARLSDMELAHVEGPWWSLRPTSEVFRQARHDAARAAVTRAGEYAEALGTRVTGLVEMADTGLSTDTGSARMYAMAAPGFAGAEAGPAPIDLEPERQTIRAEVEARFSIAPVSGFAGPGATAGDAAAR